MPSTLKTLDPTQVELEISITPEEFGAAQDAAFRTLSRNAKVPGFRPGKVPRKIFENQYGAGGIIDRALNDLINRKYPEALQEHGVEPLGDPAWDVVPSADVAGPPVVKAVVPVRPPIEPQNYTGVEIPDVPETAAEADLEAALARMQRNAATLVPVDRPVQLGDVATLDFEGKIDGVPFAGGAAQGQETEIVESGFIPGFVAGIVGMTAGQTQDVTAHFPDDYGNAELAGKDAVFTITVHDVKEAELPPLDDELAKRVSQLQTLDELRAEIKRRLDAEVKQNARRRISTELLDTIVAANDFPLPDVLIERELDALLNESRQYVARAGVQWDDYIAGSGKSEQDLRAQFGDEARRRVKVMLLVEAIAKKEGVVASPADIDAELDALATQYRQPREQIAQAIRANAGALIDGIVRTKTIDWLIEQAKRVPATETTSD